MNPVKFWYVTNRQPLERGQRKVLVMNFAAVAESAEAAIAIVRTARGHVYGSKWSASEMVGVTHVPLASSDEEPTDEERALREARIAEERVRNHRYRR